MLARSGASSPEAIVELCAQHLCSAGLSCYGAMSEPRLIPRRMPRQHVCLTMTISVRRRPGRPATCARDSVLPVRRPARSSCVEATSSSRANRCTHGGFAAGEPQQASFVGADGDASVARISSCELPGGRSTSQLARRDQVTRRTLRSCSSPNSFRWRTPSISAWLPDNAPRQRDRRRPRRRLLAVGVFRPDLEVDEVLAVFGRAWR